MALLEAENRALKERVVTWAHNVYAKLPEMQLDEPLPSVHRGSPESNAASDKRRTRRPQKR